MKPGSTKICPQCGQPAFLEAGWCAGCNHQFRTQFTSPKRGWGVLRLLVIIGVAVAVEDGLLVPVVRFADNKTLTQIGMEVRNYAVKAKDKKLQPSDWEGNTFTISNLGMFGIDEFTAIINPPDACILAVGGIKQTPVVKNGEVVPGNVMKVTLSCDHRVVDGALGSAFLQTLKLQK